MIKFERLLRGGYRASLGPWCEAGKTKKDAGLALLATIADVPPDTDPVVEIDRRGNVWVLWFEGRAWIYRRGKTTSGSCVILNTRDKSKALAAMQEHITQWLACTPEA